jgi:hypothetical protein
MAAAAGDSTKEVMARGGWSSPQMALRYEHATQDRDRFIARALESLERPVESSLQGSDSTIEAAEDRARSRTQRARRAVEEESESGEWPLTREFPLQECAPRDSNRNLRIPKRG